MEAPEPELAAAPAWRSSSRVRTSVTPFDPGPGKPGVVNHTERFSSVTRFSMALLNRRAIKSPERRFPAGAEVEDAKAAHAKQAARAAKSVEKAFLLIFVDF